MIKDEDLVLREMQKRYEKLEEGRGESKILETFTDPKLANIVSRMRRESKVSKVSRKQAKIKTRNRRKILYRYNYAVIESVAPNLPPYYCKHLAKDQPKFMPATKPCFSRLKRPSAKDIEEARRINKINITLNTCQKKETVEAPDEINSATTIENLSDCTEENDTTDDKESSIATNVNSSQSEEYVMDDIIEEEEPEMEIAEKEVEELLVEVKDEDLIKKFQCNSCEKEFSTKNGLDYHERVHTGVSPYICDVCDKKFKSSSLCSRHKQIHAKDKKYLCNVCSKSFAQKSNLSKHMDIHAGIKPFSCQSCSKSFTQKVHLDCHVMTHSKHKPWECSQCGNRFSKKSSLSRHVQSLHEENTVTDKLISDATALLEESKDMTDNFSNLNGDNFDVEVSYCDNVQMLDVGDQTFFVVDEEDGSQPTDVDKIAEDVEVEPAASIITGSKSLSEHAEQIEDIQQFLKDSQSTTAESSNSSSSVQDKGGKKLEFTKESALKIISESNFFVKNNLKNDLKNKKVLSFEEALTAATLVPKKAQKVVPAKPIKVKAVIKPSPPSESKPPTKPVKSCSKVPEVRKTTDSTQAQKTPSPPKPTPGSSDKKFEDSLINKKPIIKPLFSSNSSSSKGSAGIKLVKRPKPILPKPEPPTSSQLSVDSVDAEDKYQKMFEALKRTLLESDIKPVPSILSPTRSYPCPDLPDPVPSSSHSPTSASSTTFSNRSESHGYYTASNSSKSSPSKEGQSSSCNGITRLGSNMTRRNEDRGGQETWRMGPGTKNEADVVDSVAKVATMLPSVFPTFDQQHQPTLQTSLVSQKSFTNLHTLTGLSSIINSKPTAVVTPSTRTKIPSLPKPVPAAIGEKY